MDVYRTSDDRFDGLPDFPFQPNYVEQDGLRMHYLDEGEGKPVLLLHGEPTWSFLYRKIIPRLTGRSRCIAPDYFGFGRSDKPQAREWYSYDSHAGSIARLAEELDLRAWVADQGWSLIRSETVAEAALAAARTGDTGQAWVVQIGREPMVYEFRGVPGPR